jgi:hypothetical protein
MSGMVNVGGVLLVEQMVGFEQTWYELLLCGGAFVGIEAVKRWMEGGRTKHGARMRRILQGACTCSLSLSQAVRSSMMEKWESGNMQGRWALCIVLLVCVLSGSEMSLRTSGVWMQAWTLVSLCVGTVLQQAGGGHESGGEWVWVVLALDHLVSECGSVVVPMVLVGLLCWQRAMSEGGVEDMGTWVFLMCGFPGLCVWQSHVFSTFVKEELERGNVEKVLYALAWIGGLGMCGGTDVRVVKGLLAAHFCLRWMGIVHLTRRFMGPTGRKVGSSMA